MTEQQNYHYTEKDLKFKPRDEKQKQEILKWLNNPAAKDVAFKKEIAEIGPDASSELSAKEIQEQYRKAKVGYPQIYSPHFND